MDPIVSTVVLLTINLGLIWLLLAAPLGRRTITLARNLRASPASIWAQTGPDSNAAAWNPLVISSKVRVDAPDRIDVSYHQPDRNGNPIVRTLQISGNEATGDRNYAFDTCVIADSALDVGFWRDFRDSRVVSPADGGACLTVRQTDRYRGVAFYLYRYFALRREMTSLERFVDGSRSSQRNWFTHPAVQVASAIASTLILWPFFGASRYGLLMSSLLTLVIILHELGHMAAYRAFGHASAKMIFIPLLGGIAIGGRPYNSQFEQATCALMGAGMSAFLVPVLVAAEQSTRSGLVPAATTAPLLTLLLILGAFNILNLLPMARFDGGQVLRSLFFSRRSLAAGSFGITAVILWTGWRIGMPSSALLATLAVFTLLSLIGAGHVKPRHKLEPMTAAERLLAGFGLFAAVTIHACAVIHACDGLFG
ncbi:MAG: hypothetical protein ACOH2J_07305 [Allorhizobium sp.]